MPEVLNFQMKVIFLKNSILSKNIVLNINTNKYYNFSFKFCIIFSITQQTF